jgi:threonine/homoserine/homoserine lactone efflux protein
MNQILIIAFPLMVMMFVSSITPGPNNLMLMLAGIRFGFARTLPHLMGVTVGAVLIICLTCAGLGALLLGHSQVVDCMTIACALYLLWMATRILGLKGRSDPTGDRADRARPMRFHEAVLFQFVNPKVWTMAVAASGIAARFPYPPAVNMTVVGMTTALVNTPCIALWAACGKILRRRLEDARNRRFFNGSLALLVLLTAVWIAWPVLARSPAWAAMRVHPNAAL